MLRPPPAGGLSPGARADHLLHRLEAAGICLLQESFDLLGEMEGAGVSPSVDTYNTLMVACKQRHQLQSVPSIFRRLTLSGVLPVRLQCWVHLPAEATLCSRVLEGASVPAACSSTVVASGT